jgi:hypothetical protein
MECDPAINAEVDIEAVPELRFAVPSEVEPSKNCTLPVALDGETLAVNFTVWPNAEGLRLEEIDAVVAALFTISVIGAEVLAKNPPPPAYTAVIA